MPTIVDDLGVSEAPTPLKTVRAKMLADGIRLVPIKKVAAHRRVYLGHGVVTPSGVAQSLATAITIPTDPNGDDVFADIYCEGTSGTPTSDFIRYWHMGGALNASPTASSGKKLYNDSEIESLDPASFQFIIGAGTPLLWVEFWAARN